ncbi:hypothetical protein Busp01_39990 [Trinickia caryophylli]|nr:hypothetical protein Busp01_39990 [Trinickia caryophylli]
MDELLPAGAAAPLAADVVAEAAVSGAVDVAAVVALTMIMDRSYVLSTESSSFDYRGDERCAASCARAEYPSRPLSAK